MKRPFIIHAILVCLSLFLFESQGPAGVFKNWINTSGGSWFDPNNWSPAGVPVNGDAAMITNSGTYSVYAPTGLITCTSFTIGGLSGKQTFIYGSAANGQLFMTNSSVENNGVLVVTNGGISGALIVKSGGELDLNSQSSLFFYNFALTNQGTVNWSNGPISTGGTFPAITYITNSGSWLMTVPDLVNMGSGGGNISYFYNSGTVQKTSGAGANTMGITFVNLPSGLVNVTSGTLNLAGQGTNSLGGTFTASSPALLKFTGNNTDAGGTMSGTGAFQFTFGNFYARTNIDSHLKLIGGEIYITGTTTFQQGGAITNLTLDGANLHGTNQIAGTLTVNFGNVMDYVTVLPTGQLSFMGSSQLYYTPLLMNLGTVTCNAGLAFCGNPPTVVSNGGTWNIIATSDSLMSSGGPGAGAFTNAGIVQKTAGPSSMYSFSGFPIVNLPSGVIRAASGTLRMINYTNVAGEVQLAGGTFNSGYYTTNGMTGGKLDGAGFYGGAAAFDGGTVSPGPASALIQFQSSLVLGTNVILTLDGTSTVPGVSYDQLSVAGPVTISNATLQVTSLPSVPIGTTFVIITNVTGFPTVGNFNGLPENAPLTISGQPFRIHYSGGDGNDVVLVRDSGTGAGPNLSNGGFVNKNFKVLGAGSTATIYTIQASTNLVQWTNVGMATGDVSGNFNFTDTNALNFRYRFYRTTN